MDIIEGFIVMDMDGDIVGSYFAAKAAILNMTDGDICVPALILETSTCEPVAWCDEFDVNLN